MARRLALGLGAIAVLLAMQGCARSRRPEAGASFTGLASFYSPKLAGRATASGEPYDPGAATCAHRSVPFGTRLEITDLASGRSVVCRVNDRGPFVRGRVVDLSGSLARRLGIVDRGVAKVRVRVLPR